MFNFLNPRAGSGVVHIAADEAIALAAEGKLTVIDVRDQTEVDASGKAKGALHIPLMMLRFHADPRNPECRRELDVNKPVALYCASGARSNMAGQQMMEMGYTDVRNIGGFRDWAAAGGPVE